MRKLLFAIISLMVLTSCAKNNEEKARELIEPEVKANLIRPDSYDFVSMRLDSCFADCENDPEYLAFALNAARLFKEYKKYTSEVEEAEGKMSINAGFSGPQDAYPALQYKKYKAEMEKAQRKADAIREQILSACKAKQSQLLASPPRHEFIGWMAIITYRVETAGGIKTMSESTYFLNNDLTQITAHLSREDLEELQSANISDFAEEFGEEMSIKN